MRHPKTSCTAPAKNARGFTLVELAIVMTIIGLLIGGILKGQELMMNARLTTTIAQMKSYEAATITFRDTYGGLPGDLATADNVLPRCTSVCRPPAASASNNVVGLVNWTTATDWPMQAISITSNNMVPQTETLLFWTHLVHADLISGVGTAPTTFITPEWGVTHPRAPVNGGFIVGFSDGQNPPPGGVNVTALSGLVIALTTSPSGDLTSTPGVHPLSAGEAAQIDRKMDDGQPGTGYVHAYGVTASCYTSGTALIYNEGTTGNDCGLIFRIQG